MALAHSPSIVTNDLVLHFDLGNRIKNPTANISTNLVQNGNFTNGAGSPMANGNVATNEIVQLANPGDTPFVLRQKDTGAEYQLNFSTGYGVPAGELSSSTTYVMSCWFATSVDYVGPTAVFHSRAYATGGSHAVTAAAGGTLLYSVVINGITWEYRYKTITTPSDFTGLMEWYVGYSNSAYTSGYKYFANLRLERGSFPSIYNLLGTGSNGRVDNNATYSSSNGGSLVFDGTDDYVEGTMPLLSGSVAIEFVFKVNNTTTNLQNIFTQGQHVVSFSCGVHLATSNLRFRNSAGDHLFSPNASIVANQWYHCVVTSDGNGSYVYLNGSYIGSTTQKMSTNNVQTFILGKRPTVAEEYLNGNIANLKIYNRALTPAEIQQNYNAIRGRFGI